MKLKTQDKRLIAVAFVGASFLCVGLFILLRQAPTLAVLYALALLATALFAAQLEIYRRVQFLLNHAHENYRQTEALFSLFSLLKIRRPLPPLRDFAISPDFANLLVTLIDETRPRVILELGSGASTLITGYRLQQLGQGRIISLEHDEKYATVTRARLTQHELNDVVTLIHAPLAEIAIGEKKWKWYDQSAWSGIERIDLLVVDGPPARTQSLARYPALPLLRSKLADGAVVVLEDAARADEKKTAELWQREFPDFALEYVATEKGAAVFRRAR